MDNNLVVPSQTQHHLVKGRQLVKNAWAIYKADFQSYFIIALIIGLFGTVNGIFAVYHPQGSDAPITTPWLVLLVVVIILGIISAVWGGIAILYKATRYENKLTVGQSFKQSTHLLWPLITTGFLVTLVVLGGLILLIIPGIIWALQLSLTNNIVAKEGLKNRAAMRRSRYLTKNYVGEIFSRGVGAGIVVGLPVWIISLVITVALVPLGTPGLIAGIFLRFLLNSLVLPIGVLVSYLIYQGMVQIKESAGGATPAAPASTPMPPREPVVPNPIS